MKSTRSITIAGVILAVLFIAAGCTSYTSPLDPATTSPVDVSTTDHNWGTTIWGAWTIVYDTETDSIAIIEARIADGTLNVLGFLEPPPLTTLAVENYQLLPFERKLNADLVLNHPYKASGEFTGFDVKGVVIGGELLNADGYTAWMNPDDFTGIKYGYIDGLLGTPDSEANYQGADWGYKYYATGLGRNESLTGYYSEESNLNKRGKFGENQSLVRHYEIQFATSKKYHIFNYAIVANHAWPTGNSPYTLSDFSIATANGQEAFNVDAEEISNSLWWDSDQETGGGTLDLDVEVWDWQGLDNTSVTVSAPGILSATTSTHTSGSTSRSGIYSFTNLAPNLSSADSITLSITATDNSATFGSAWYNGLLPTNNSKYNTKVYTMIKLAIDVTEAGG